MMETVESPENREHVVPQDLWEAQDPLDPSDVKENVERVALPDNADRTVLQDAPASVDSLENKEHQEHQDA